MKIHLFYYIFQILTDLDYPFILYQFQLFQFNLNLSFIF